MWHRRTGAWSRPRARPRGREGLIYCVVPRELEEELYDQLVEHYRDDPNVTVIVDRRVQRERRHPTRRGSRAGRRRQRITGTFPPIEGVE